MNKTLHFWYEFASPYSCLAALQVEKLAKGEGVEVIWHPFLLGAIFKMMQIPAPPMQLSPQKERYMWMDAQRQAKSLGVPFKTPSRFPRAAVLPARVALTGRDAGWCPEFSRQVYLANFTRDEDISSPAVITEILENMGLDAKAVLERATAEDNKLALRRETQEAYDAGIFGVPTFFAGDEMFWGNDRLREAIAAAAR